ncbi:MAG: glycoside hydrolase family 2 TIM barrel-domain containing protein [Endomicrobiaceae bacterium]|nr:glycoside hydrolase family 2 TIM barrel-domain containing protein [Endomicrobiaceae bacterium]
MLKKIILLQIIFASIYCSFITDNAFSDVHTVQDENGVWRLIVNNTNYFIKGLEYSPDVVGISNPAPNEWMNKDLNGNEKADGPYDAWVDLNRNDFQDSDENAVGDFALIKAMGCNTIRIYHCENINKEVLRDLYSRFGIRVIMGNYLGAYTKGSNADWNSGTDYSDKKHRQNMKDNIEKMVMEFKDEPYILMWMLGNENDSSGMDSNSTTTKTNACKDPKAFAEFVEEICHMIKNIDKTHPIGICNATTKFLKVYAKYAPSIDILGFNQYSGPYGLGSFWNRVKQDFDRPVLITEFGCDVYNSKKNTTDEAYQVKYHRNVWKDIEKNSYWDDSGAGNSIGGVVYCWLDKWWLAGSAKIHDTTLGAWAGPTIDGLFNDEWLGICGQGNGRKSPFQRVLRSVYFLYQEELWNWDPATF